LRGGGGLGLETKEEETYSAKSGILPNYLGRYLNSDSKRDSVWRRQREPITAFFQTLLSCFLAFRFRTLSPPKKVTTFLGPYNEQNLWAEGFSRRKGLGTRNRERAGRRREAHGASAAEVVASH